jgi:hypothetical protein
VISDDPSDDVPEDGLQPGPERRFVLTSKPRDVRDSLDVASLHPVGGTLLGSEPWGSQAAGQSAEEGAFPLEQPPPGVPVALPSPPQIAEERTALWIAHKERSQTGKIVAKI